MRASDRGLRGAFMMIIIIIVKTSQGRNMRVTKERAGENHDRALSAPRRNCFAKRDFDAVGVAELMRAAGLTHGGFYNHFASKEAIEAEACADIFAGSVRRLGRWRR